MTKQKGKFIRFIGSAWLAGKGVAVYQEGDLFRLCAETAGGNPVRYINGAGEWRTVRDMVLSESEYDEFRDRVRSGSAFRSDAAVVHRALLEMGYPGEGDHGDHLVLSLRGEA